jgi:two-component system chemotaxis response regulator CheY
MASVIMIVEDHETVRASLHGWIQGVFPASRILQAASGEAALALAEEIAPDVVLMDIGLPGMNGIEAAERLTRRFPATRVVMLTILEDESYRTRALAAGAAAFVPKRLMETDLIPVLAGWLSPDSPDARSAGGERGGDAAVRPASDGDSRADSLRTILVVDDSATMRRMVMAALRELPRVGFDEARSGLEAIERLALVRPALVMLDLNMPDMHGLEVLQFIRRHQAFRELPVVVLTTRGDEASRTATLAAGASLYLTKPFDPRALAAQVGPLLEA